MLDLTKFPEDALYRRAHSNDRDESGPAQAEIKRRGRVREDAKFEQLLAVSRWSAYAAFAAAGTAGLNVVAGIIMMI